MQHDATTNYHSDTVSIEMRLVTVSSFDRFAQGRDRLLEGRALSPASFRVGFPWHRPWNTMEHHVEICLSFYIVFYIVFYMRFYNSKHCVTRALCAPWSLPGSSASAQCWNANAGKALTLSLERNLSEERPEHSGSPLSQIRQGPGMGIQKPSETRQGQE